MLSVETYLLISIILTVPFAHRTNSDRLCRRGAKEGVYAPGDRGIVFMGEKAVTPLRALACPFATCRRSNALIAALALALAAAVAPTDRASAQGLVFEPDDAYAQYPKLERHRAFLPESVDLSARFPTPGDQGNQGSCVGWAVGYAARSYYAVAREGRPRNQIGD